MVTTGKRRTICLLTLFFFLPSSYLLRHFFLLCHARDEEIDAPSITGGWTERWSEGFEGGDREWNSQQVLLNLSPCATKSKHFFPLHWQNGSSGPNNARRRITRRIKVTHVEMVEPSWHVLKGLEMKQIRVFFFFPSSNLSEIVIDLVKTKERLHFERKEIERENSIGTWLPAD